MARKLYKDNASLLIAAMAEQCRGMILECERPDADLPQSPQLDHLKRIVREN